MFLEENINAAKPQKSYNLRYIRKWERGRRGRSSTLMPHPSYLFPSCHSPVLRHMPLAEFLHYYTCCHYNT